MAAEEVVRVSRNRILMVLAVAGVLAGFAMVRWWNPASVPSAPTAAPAASELGTAPSTSDLRPPGERGSSMSVVGTMSREEMVRRGIAVPEDPAETAAAQGNRPGDPGREGPPASLNFPPEVGQAAGSFMCLCGCGHTLDECPCNDQPIGAVTMLTYLQKLMAVDPDPSGLSAGMVDRYGEQVLVPPSEP